MKSSNRAWSTLQYEKVINEYTVRVFLEENLENGERFLNNAYVVTE